MNAKLWLMAGTGYLYTGVGVAFLASLIFKTRFLRHHHAPLESCMVRLGATGCAFCLLECKLR